MSRTEAVILDIDGTLLRSNDAHAEAFVRAGREQGHEVEFDQVRWLIGMGSDKLVPRVFGFEADSAEGRALQERKGEIFREELLPGLEPTPGARELLVRLREEGLTLTVATSAAQDELKGLLDRAGIADLLEERKTTSASEVEETKPDPDVVEAALQKAGCPAEAAVMIGDTPFDVESATRAGVRILAVRTGGWEDAALVGALAIFDDPADLLAHLDETPLGGRGGRG
jgi:HAD superfamily hydrolase (TIGR01509 family)